MAETYQQLEKRRDELGRENARLKHTLKMGLEIWDEYMGQIGHCVSQDYARLNEFPIQCAELGVKLNERD